MTQPKAFTLVETLVAIAILMIAIIGPFMEVQHALVASYIARDQLIANSLAEEGIEYVRTIRDGNYLMSRANPSSPRVWFMAGLDSNFPNGSNGDGSTISGNCFSQTCYVDQYATTITNTAKPLYINSIGSTPSYLYNQQSNGTVTRFTRGLNLCYMQTNGTCTATPSNEVRVTVTVTWTTEGSPQTTSVVDYIQNWL